MNGETLQISDISERVWLCRWLFFAAIISCVWAGDLAAQSDYTFRVVDSFGSPSTAEVPGATKTMHVRLDNIGVPLDGWSFGVCQDTTDLVALSAALGAPVAALNPAFENVDVSAEGVTVGVVLSFAPPFQTLPIGLGIDLLTIDYQVSGSIGSVTTISPCSTLGSPPVALVVVAEFLEIVPDIVSGTVTVGNPVSTTSVLQIGSATAGTGEEVTLPITLDLIDTDGSPGLSFGVAFDSSRFTPLSLDLGVDLAAVRSGQGPSFFGPNVHAGGGVTLGVLTDFNQPPSMLPAGLDLHIADLTLEVSETAPLGSNSLDFSGQLGTPPAIIEVLVSSANLVQSVTPVLVSGSVAIEPGFLRGDLNGDGALTIMDAHQMLMILFLSADPVPCHDLLDINDDGTAGILDVIQLLEFLFILGPAPVGYPNCSSDKTPEDPLGCDSPSLLCP